MNTLLAVIDDLFRFACASLFGQKEAGTYNRSFSIPYMNAMQMQLLPAKRSSQEGEGELSLDHARPLPPSGELQFVGHSHAPLHTDPVMAFDVHSALIPYGEQVRVLKLGGRWAFVRYKDQEGWVLKDSLREQAREVLPSFEHGHLYDAHDEETIKLRLCIDDEFCGGKASLPLTDAEYVTYKLRQKQISIPWNTHRPRTPGTWHTLLRGKKGVHCGVLPKTGSIAEYIVEDVGYVAYVEAVFPDESIKLSSVGLSQEGLYTIETLSREYYRELHPIFIEIQ